MCCSICFCCSVGDVVLVFILIIVWYFIKFVQRKYAFLFSANSFSLVKYFLAMCVLVFRCKTIYSILSWHFKIIPEKNVISGVNTQTPHLLQSCAPACPVYHGLISTLISIRCLKRTHCISPHWSNLKKYKKWKIHERIDTQRVDLFFKYRWNRLNFLMLMHILVAERPTCNESCAMLSLIRVTVLSIVVWTPSKRSAMMNQWSWKLQTVEWVVCLNVCWFLCFLSALKVLMPAATNP